MAEYYDAPEVHGSVAADRELAASLGITAAPSVQVGDVVFRAEEMPDDIDAQIEALLFR